MIIDIFSIFPSYLDALKLSLPGKAIDDGLLDLRVHDLRDWTHDRHRTVDDTPYGGGAGMLMKPEPWGEALDSVLDDGGPTPRLLVMTPSGKPFTQEDAERLATQERLVFACGRYEGFDARIVEHFATRMPVEEISIGDYVLNGGEVASLVCIEAIVRLIPGVIGNPESLIEESHATGAEHLVEYPSYTKPPVWRGLGIPEVLLSGHHANIAQWRLDQARQRTRERRPDLLGQD
ncbi:MAG: tRNA (guanosine(37)-N1)-methyltransferase TrmD [Propionibacteriaceae bacterium]